MPLASCHYQEQPGTKKAVDKVIYYYVLPQKNEQASASRYLPAALFILPLLLSLLSLSKTIQHYGWDILASVLALMMLAYIAIYAFITKLEWGAYVSFLVIGLYLLANIGSIMAHFRQRRAHHPS